MLIMSLMIGDYFDLLNLCIRSMLQVPLKIDTSAKLDFNTMYG
jgi:hypothetical protein